MDRSNTSERGASLVEFALLVPIFVVLIMGLVQFGRAYSIQISLEGAAREGARSLALNESTTTVKSKAIAAAPGVSLAAGDVTVNTACTTVNGALTGDAKITVSKSVNFSFGTFLPFSRTLSASATMRCGL